jgi:hypothetical protein
MMIKKLAGQSLDEQEICQSKKREVIREAAKNFSRKVLWAGIRRNKFRRV